jgi:Fe-S-cluster containining protein/Tfp pilus assembly protein PilF
MFRIPLKQFYTAIAQVYQEVAHASPPSMLEGNPCGECRSCCTSAIAAHRVTELELATMAHHVGEEKVNRFRRFLKRERDPRGALVFSECPNLVAQGCSVHEFRPLSCRLYGLFRAESAPLFDHCAFRGHETVLPDRQEHLLTPGQARLAELSIEYLSYFPVANGDGPGSVLKEPQTELERAGHLQVSKDYPAAIALLLELRQSEDSPTVMLMLAECYEHLKDYPAAITILDEAIARSPQNAELLTRQGRCYLYAGQLEQAEQALRRSLALAEDRRNAQGLLGFVLQLSGQSEAAVPHLARAVQLEEEPGPFRFQLALALKTLGRLAESRDVLELAFEFEPSIPQARQLWAELDQLEQAR